MPEGCEKSVMQEIKCDETGKTYPPGFSYLRYEKPGHMSRKV